MKRKEIVFLLEEESTKVMLEGVLPKLLTVSIPVRYITFDGKQDLEKHIIKKLRGYINPDAIFIILRDQDDSDCIQVKKKLMQKCIEANRPNAVVRIVCKELESWYLADLKAVEKAYLKNGISELQNKKKFRCPDSLSKPSNELKKIVPEYQKVNGSRRIAKFMDIDNNRSKSFYHLIKAINKILST